jgi:2-polyprenyl-3-methyl-5-hydroxy-6-metoxy-1,4-benzoquinol methylase
VSTEIPEYGQDEMAHPLPRTSIVDRIPWLVEQCRGKRVIHVGFADAGFREEQGRAGSWLHGHLAEVATSLVGLDFDGPGVQAALDAGHEAHLVDCTDPAAVAALDLEPADVVLAGEVIEHLGAPGPFLEAMAGLCAPNGTLVITTPNAYGLVNVVASLTRRVEVNHPDHVVMFTWRTLTQLLERGGWSPTGSVTYVPTVRDRGDRSRLESAAVRGVLGLERLLGRLGRPYSADGLIVTAQRRT